MLVKMAEREISLTLPVCKIFAYSIIFCAYFIVNCQGQFFENPKIDEQVVLWKKGEFWGKFGYVISLKLLDNFGFQIS